MTGGDIAVSACLLVLKRKRHPRRILAANAAPLSARRALHEVPPAAGSGLEACFPLVRYTESSGMRYGGGSALTRRLAGLRQLPGDRGAADGGRSGRDQGQRGCQSPSCRGHWRAGHAHHVRPHPLTLAVRLSPASCVSTVGRQRSAAQQGGHPPPSPSGCCSRPPCIRRDATCSRREQTRGGRGSILGGVSTRACRGAGGQGGRGEGRPTAGAPRSCGG